VVEAGRRNRDEPRRQLEHFRVPHLEGGGVVQLHELLADRVRDLRPGVAGIDTPEAGCAVEQALAFRVPVVHALCADQHARRLLELPVRRERHPERFEIVGGEMFLHGANLPRQAGLGDAGLAAFWADAKLD
jgi:hypothetical protein